MSGAAVAARLARQLTVTVLLSNVSGAVVVFTFLIFLLPTDAGPGQGVHQQVVNACAFVAYIGVAAPLGIRWGRRLTEGVVHWLRAEHPADDAVRTLVLRAPLHLTMVSAVLWAGAAVVFGLLNLAFSAMLTTQVATAIVLGGVTTSALAYMLVERLMRPAVTLAHAASHAAPPVLVGVTRRLLLAWGVGSGVPLVGIGMGFVRWGDRRDLGAAGVLFLVAVGLVVGCLATVAAARAVADPVGSVAAALREVGQGRLDVEVPVYDASEVGQLQSGFNAMARGLREREQLRDLFGRQVGTDVARLALEQGVRLGGERRDVAVLFVDVVGSTGLAEALGPEEVVARLNAFFGLVVEVVTAEHGFVNKFEGDAALCIFGAPAELPDARERALRAARTLSVRLSPLPLAAAIGVCAGAVVAGHVGAESRFEYTVIGDPVNAAARLTELAKTAPGRVLADAEVVASAGPEEAACWQDGEEVALRGRATTVRLAAPVRA